MGEAYLGAAVTFAQAFAQLDKGMRPEFVTAGRPLADKYWADYSERAKKEQLCD
jgi:hypothetical protein